MTDNESELWNKIKSFRFDEPTAVLTFSKRLARENGLEREFAELIVEEYRRFIFLCCVSPKQVSPSFFVDQAWHLHLTYTRSYWVDLCQNTLGRDIHHNPTQGGIDEDNKFKGLYQETKALYRHYFETEPPPSIWPADDKDPRQPLVELDPSTAWIIAKPSIDLGNRRTPIAVSIVALLTLSAGCTAYPSPTGLIVIAIAAIAVSVFIFMWWRRGRNRRGSGSYSSGCGGGIIGISGCSDDSYDAADSSDSSESSSSDSSSDSGSSCSSGCSSGCGGGGD